MAGGCDDTNGPAAGWFRVAGRTVLALGRAEEDNARASAIGRRPMSLRLLAAATLAAAFLAPLPAADRIYLNTLYESLPNLPAALTLATAQKRISELRE